MKLRVEVVWALPGRQRVVRVELDEGATAAEAVAAAGLGASPAALGRHGERIEPGTVLEQGDRVELLRPLAADPKEARRRRARRDSV
ncbi:MAG TPA: RnfH family protein [Burkholderiales bacterium]|nr:RnfH family protein [Burkholderiales bacterium]